MKTFPNFTALKPATGTAGEITVVCLATGKRAIWNDAAAAGWVADTTGPSFRAYYSPEGRAIVEASTAKSQPA